MSQDPNHVSPALRVGERVRIKHNVVLDRRYQNGLRPARERCDGEIGTIQLASDGHGHGACFLVLTPSGDAWFEPEELERAT